MNFNGIGRVLVCLLLVCCLIINISPIRAEASAIAATATVVSVPGLNVVAAVLIGLGVCAGIASVDWDNVVYSCAEKLEDLGIIDEDGNCKILQFPDPNGGVPKWLANLALVEAIRDWLFDSGTISEKEEILISGSGFQQDDYSNSNSNLFWKNVSLDCLTEEGVLLTSYSGGYYCGLSLNSEGLVSVVRLKSLTPYTNLDFPFGSVVDGLSVHSETRYNMRCYKNYASALAYYQSTGSQCYFLTSDSYLSFPTSNQLYYIGYHYINSLGHISNMGQVSYGNSNYEYYNGKQSYCYGLYPSYTSTSTSISVSDGLNMDYIAPYSQSIAEGYADWYSNSIAITDEETNETTIGLPVPNVGTYEDLSSITQEQVWSGTVSGAGTTTEPVAGSFADTTVKSFLASLTDTLAAPFAALAEAIVAGVQAIFVPTTDFVTAKVDALCANYGFADSIMQTGLALKSGLSGVTTEPPVIYIHLENTEGSYNIGGTVAFLDLTWYAKYKPTVDTLISAFLWICFIWRMIVKLPGIISGMPGDFVMASAHQMGIDSHLPTRSKEYATQRMTALESIRKGPGK